MTHREAWRLAGHICRYYRRTGRIIVARRIAYATIAALRHYPATLLGRN